MIYIDWGDVEQSWRLQDGDVVQATEENIDPNTTEFKLVFAPHKKWWKGLQLIDNTDAQIGFIEVHDNIKESDTLRAC